MARESPLPDDAKSSGQANDVDDFPLTGSEESMHAGYIQAARSHMGNCDDEILGQVAEAFLKECPRRIADIRAALETEDVAAITRAAHTIKSSARIFDAVTAAELAEQIEELSRNGSHDSIAMLTDQLERQTASILDELRRFLGR